MADAFRNQPEVFIHSYFLRPREEPSADFEYRQAAPILSFNDVYLTSLGFRTFQKLRCHKYLHFVTQFNITLQALTKNIKEKSVFIENLRRNDLRNDYSDTCIIVFTKFNSYNFV